MPPEAGIPDHLGQVKSQSVQRKHEHIDSHYVSKTESRIRNHKLRELL